MNPFAVLLKSRKFWLMVLDVVVSFTTYFVTKYVDPEMTKDILFILGGLQLPLITVIGAIAYEDGKGMDMTAKMDATASISATAAAKAEADCK